MVIGGLVLLVVPGVYLAVRFAPFVYVLGSRSASPRDGLRDAAALIAGCWWSTFGLRLGLLAIDLAPSHSWASDLS